MSSVYTNIAKKRIEQSQAASQPPSEVTEQNIQNADQQELVQEKNISIQSSSQTQSQKEDTQKYNDTMIPRHHGTMVSRNHDTTIPYEGQHIFEIVRKSVKHIGEEAATHRFTLEEKNELADIEYIYKRQGIRTSENEITRIAINYFVEDYKQNGEQSLLAKILKRLNS